MKFNLTIIIIFIDKKIKCVYHIIMSISKELMLFAALNHYFKLYFARKVAKGDLTVFKIMYCCLQ